MPWPLTPEQVFLATEALDMRMGVERLSQYVEHSLGRRPTDGSAYAFCNRSGNRLKLLIWDGNGVWLSVRRLHKGRFVWPSAGEALCTLSANDWHWLISGIDWQRVHSQPSAAWQV